MTVNQLAMYSGISAASISRYETGDRRPPKPSNIKKLASALKYSYEELMQLAGHLPTEIEDTSKNPAQKLIEYLDMELTDDEILDRMTFKVDNITLSDEEVKEFIAFVRAKRFMKTGLSAPSKSEEP